MPIGCSGATARRGPTSGSTLPDDVAHLVASDPPDLLPAVLSLRTSAIATCGTAMAMRDAQATGDADRTANFAWLAIMRDGRAPLALHGFAVMERLSDALALRWPDAPALGPRLDVLVRAGHRRPRLRRIARARADHAAPADGPGHRRVAVATPTHALFDGDRQPPAWPGQTPRQRCASRSPAARRTLRTSMRAHEFGLALWAGGLMPLELTRPPGVEHERDIYALLHRRGSSPNNGTARPRTADTRRPICWSRSRTSEDLHTHDGSDGRDAVDAIVCRPA
jgi:hypothetical protein